MSSSPFTRLQTTVHRKAAALMGYSAIWGEHTARVLFQNPTDAMKFSGVEWDATAWRMEYHYNDFPGLKALVDARAAKQRVQVDGAWYFVTSVDRKWDGKTYYAALIPGSAPPPPPPEPEPEPEP